MFILQMYLQLGVQRCKTGFTFAAIWENKKCIEKVKLYK